jgi:predicted alpha/beta superfamily hydrolase
MELIIKKNIEWDNIYIVILNENRKKVDSFKLKFSKFNYTKLVLDLTIHKYIYFTNHKIKTETVILSEGLYGLEIRYNKLTNRYDPLLFNKEDNHSTVKTYILKDKKNLPMSKDNKKVINVLLPSNYDKHKDYGLLIMIDSQNLYNNNIHNYTKLNDPYGGWQVDTTLEVLSKKYNKDIIVVGIETTGNERMFELTQNKDFGKTRFLAKNIYNNIMENGHLDDTNNFIFETVLPFIKANYNINDFIGICGSSAGGNAAYYCALKHQDIIKYSLPFSPAHTLFDDNTILNFHSLHNFPNIPLYICCGQVGRLEKLLYTTNKKFIKLMNKINYKNIYKYYEKTADHNEILWRYSFADAMSRVFKEIK